jgi:hypothetical protein
MLKEKKQEGLEVSEEGEVRNPYGKMTDYEKRLMEKATGEKAEEEGEDEESEEAEEAEAEEGEEEEGEDEAEDDKGEKVNAEADKERKEKMRKDLESALYSSPAEQVIDKNEEDMSDTEKSLAKQLREERIKNARREENDMLVKLLDPYTAEEQEIIVPEIRKFLKDEAYKALSSLPAAKRAAFALNHARGILADKLQVAAEQRAAAKTEARQKVEQLAKGPNKKARKVDPNVKLESALRKAAANGDRRAAQKLAGLNDPVLDGIIKRTGGA